MITPMKPELNNSALNRNSLKHSLLPVYLLLMLEKQSYFTAISVFRAEVGWSSTADVMHILDVSVLHHTWIRKFNYLCGLFPDLTSWCSLHANQVFSSRQTFKTCTTLGWSLASKLLCLEKPNPELTIYGFHIT